MALRTDLRTDDDAKALDDRFAIAQDAAEKPTERALFAQRQLRDAIREAAHAIDVQVAPSRAKSTALTKLEEALLWAGKGLFE